MHVNALRCTRGPPEEGSMVRTHEGVKFKDLMFVYSSVLDEQREQTLGAAPGWNEF